MGFFKNKSENITQENLPPQINEKLTEMRNPAELIEKTKPNIPTIQPLTKNQDKVEINIQTIKRIVVNGKILREEVILNELKEGEIIWQD